MTLIYIRRIHVASNTHFFLLLAPLHWERAPSTTMNTILPSLQSSHQPLHPTSTSKAAQGRKGNLNHSCRVSCSHWVSLEARIHFAPLRMGLGDNMGDKNLAMRCSFLSQFVSAARDSYKRRGMQSSRYTATQTCSFFKFVKYIFGVW